MIHRLSASGLGRARSCLYWARPDSVWPEQEPSRHLHFGNAGHAACEATIKTGAEVDPLLFAEALDDVDAARLERAYAQWLAWWQKQPKLVAWHAEQAFAWNVRTGAVRALTRTTHRDYGTLDDWEVPGTVDAIGVGGAVVHVKDWKTGRGAVESSATNMQLAHNGACAAKRFEAFEAHVGIVKLGEESVFVDQPAILSAFDFDATRDEIRTMIEGVATSEPKPGPHCQFCPAKGACPATAEAVSDIVSAASLVRRVPVSLDIQDNDHAAGMLTAVDAVESFVVELKKRLRAYADDHGGIAMPDGTVYARTDITTERPDLSVPGAIPIVCEAGAKDAIKASVSWADIKRLGGKDAEKRVRDALRELGAVKTSTAPRYEAKPVKKEKRSAA